MLQLANRDEFTHSSFFLLTGTVGLKSSFGFAAGSLFLSVLPMTTGADEDPLAADGTAGECNVPIRGFTSDGADSAGGGGGGEDMRGPRKYVVVVEWELKGRQVGEVDDLNSELGEVDPSDDHDLGHLPATLGPHPDRPLGQHLKANIPPASPVRRHLGSSGPVYGVVVVVEAVCEPDLW